MDAVSNLLPAGAFPKFLLFVGVAAVYNSVQCFVPKMRLTHRIYANKPKEATALAARLMGLWTFTSAIIRVYTAYDMSNPALYQLCMLTFSLALFGFLGEVFVHKTAPMTSPGVFPAILISSCSLGYMILNYSQYVVVAATGYANGAGTHSDL
ncbi:Erg28 like protein-domain-containing protein [Chytriomyces sp. MP71]|nr:Erg28 like protein-domain-containing protein [Chytriomyces sp. MP71]